MIVQLEDPPSSVLIERRTKEETGIEFLSITQFNNVHLTKVEDFYSYLNELSRGDLPSPLMRAVDANFVIVPLQLLKEFIDNPQSSN